MAQSIFTPGPGVYNVQAESPVAAVDPGYGAIGQGLSNLGTGLATYMKLSGSGSGSKTGPSRDEVAEWGEGIQKIAGLPESQRAIAYKKLVGATADKGVNVGNQALTSIASTFLGDSPQFTVGEKFEDVQEEAMIKSPEFGAIFAQSSLANPGLPDDQKYQIAQDQFMRIQATQASLEQAATFAKGVWNAPDGGEAKVLAQAMAVRNFSLFDAVGKFEEGGLPASLSSLDNYGARLNAERVKYNSLARLGGVSEEDLKDYNAQIDQYTKEIENLKTTLNNDNVTPALKKVLGEVLGGNVKGLSTIADVVARLSVLESGKLAPDLQIRVMEAIGLSGGKYPTDPKELATVLGNGVSRQILESVTDTLGSRVAERPSVLDRFDLGFGTRPTPVEGSVDGQPPAQVTTSVPGTSVVTIEDLANSTDPVVKDLAIKYVNMPPSQLSPQAKTAEIFLLAPPTGPMTKDQSEIFADKVIAFSLGSQSKDKNQPYSARFVSRFWNSPNFLANMENLKTANPSLYGQVKSVLAGHLEKEINVNSKRTETAARKITEKAPWVSYDVDTGRLEINPSFYTRDAAGNLIPNRSTFEEIPPSEKLAFLKDLTENYGGDIQAAALDSYQKLDTLKFQFLKVPGYKDVKEFMDRANSTKAVAQAEANLNRDELNAVKLAPETYIRQRANRGTAVSWIGQGEEVNSLIFRGRPLARAKKRNIDQASDALSSIGQAVEDAFTFEGSGRTVTDPETGIAYNQGQTMDQAPPPPIVQPAGATSGISSVIEGGAGFTTVTKADGTVVKREGLRSWRNNNPGNLEAGDFATSKGAVGDDGRYAVFKTYEEGREAMQSLLFEGKNYRDKTISEAISRYAPPKENDTDLYIKRVTDALGVSDSTKLSDLSGDQRATMLDAMQKHEGFKEGTETVVEPSSGTGLDSQGRPFIRPEVGAEVTESSMLGSVFEAGKQALQAIGVDEETGKRVLDQLSEAGVLIKEEVSDLVSGKPSMPLPPRRPEFLGGLPEAQAKKISTEESYKKLNIEEIANDTAANGVMKETVAITSRAIANRKNPLGAIITEWFGVSENNKVGRDTLKAVFKSAIPSTDWENADLTDFAWCTAALSAILYDTNNLMDNQPNLDSSDEPSRLKRNIRRAGIRIQSDRNKALAYSTVGTALPLTKETPSFSSLSNEKIPEKIPDNTPVGSLVVFSWGMNEEGKEGKGHTALYTGRQQLKSSDRSKLIFGNNKKVPHILVAGGNQGDQLKLSWFPAADVRDLRKLKNIPDMTREEIQVLNRLTKAEGAERNVTFPEGYDKILPPRRPESME